MVNKTEINDPICKTAESNAGKTIEQVMNEHPELKDRLQTYVAAINYGTTENGKYAGGVGLVSPQDGGIGASDIILDKTAINEIMAISQGDVKHMSQSIISQSMTGEMPEQAMKYACPKPKDSRGR